MGIPEEQIAQIVAASARPEVFEVWSDNVATLNVFLSCSSQWRMLAGYKRNAYLGLDYPALEVVMKHHRIKDRAAMFADIQTMEWAALKVLNGE